MHTPQGGLANRASQQSAHWARQQNAIWVRQQRAIGIDSKVPAGYQSIYVCMCAHCFCRHCVKQFLIGFVDAAVPELRTANSQRSFSVEAAAAEFDMRLWR